MTPRPTGICRYCARVLNYDYIRNPLDWRDNAGRTYCSVSNSHKHYPVDPVEGVDY